MPAKLVKSLRGLGLSISESVILGVLLQRGSLSASRVAKEVRLNRTTTYGVLNELIAKGLVSKVGSRRVTQYQAISPEMLPAYVAKRREELAEHEKDLQEAIPKLLLLREKAHALPKVQFFEGEDGIKRAYEDALENNSKKFLRGISGADTAFHHLGGKWATYYLEKRTKLGIRCVDLVPESGRAQESRQNDEKYLRTTKFFPREYSFNAEFALYDDKIGIFSYAKENPVVVLIEDETIAHAMKQLFDFIETKAV